jgi:hypothetical protein
MPLLYLALAHYPVTNKNGDIITSAITNLDLHDISRAARTYGVKSFYVITPLTDQKALAERIVTHWTHGAGADYNPARRDALDLIRLVDTIEDAARDIGNRERHYPKIVATGARKHPSSIGYAQFRGLLKKEMPYLLVFGTAWGLAESFRDQADYVLEPVIGATDYNHLSVRSAAAIVLDRLAGIKN